MMVFWGLAILMTAVVGGLIVTGMLRRPEPVAAPEHHDIDVYRDQLKDIDREVARGVLAEEEAERVRVEVSRRILAADRAHQAEDTAPGQPGRTTSFVAAGVVMLAIVGGSAALYLRLGAPGYPDLPIQTRLAAIAEAKRARPLQAAAEAQVGDATSRLSQADPAYVKLVERLRLALKDRPNSLEGHIRLVQAEANLGNYSAAAKAQAKVISLKGKDATAGDYRDQAELMILAAGGYVSPEAESALTQSLTRDRTDGAARYYSGLLFYQTGRPDRAFRLWRDLLEEAKPGDPWIVPVRALIEDAAKRAGIPYTLPDANTAAGQDQMIRGMVERLSTRLATEGGSAEEWARLIRAYGVLGEKEQAAAIWANAQQVFAQSPEALDKIRVEAKGAGVAE